MGLKASKNKTEKTQSSIKHYREEKRRRRSRCTDRWDSFPKVISQRKWVRQRR